MKKNSQFGASFKTVKEPVIVEPKPIEVNDIEDSPQKDVTSLAFREDLQKMLEKRLPAAGAVSNVLEVLPSKKKVLFDMKNLDEPKKFEDISELAEEDSDFDISSFASEVEDVK